MADQQPGEHPPAAGPDPTRLEDGADPSTVDAPARWSGAAAVPPPAPKRPWWRRGDPARSDEPPTDEWVTPPAVDPWADQATPWDAFPLVPEAVITPEPPAPTRVEAPVPTRIEPPPAAVPPPPPATPQPAPRPAPQPPAAPKPAAPEPAAPKSAPPTGWTRWRRKPRAAQPPVDRLPVQTRPPAAPTVMGRPVPAPPPWAPRQAARPLPPPPRRKRRWGRRLLLFGLLGVVCCCGVPFAWLRYPAARQYPVTAVLPKSFADLRLLETEPSATHDFAGVYGDSRGKRVTVFGVTGFRVDPGSDVREQLDRITDEYRLTGVQSFDTGEAGVHERCGTGRDKGTSVVVCAWADHGSLATVLLTRRSTADSAELVARLREEVLTEG